jgi:hypothetical protein
VEGSPRGLNLDSVANLRDEAALLRMDDDGARAAGRAGGGKSGVPQPLGKPVDISTRATRVYTTALVIL